jgi:hypothetical protein
MPWRPIGLWEVCKRCPYFFFDQQETMLNSSMFSIFMLSSNSQSLSLFLWGVRIKNNYVLLLDKYWNIPITVTARSEAWTVFACSNTGVVGSIPTRGMDVGVRLFCVCVVLCLGSGLATDWSPVQGILQTVYRLRNWRQKRPRFTRTVEPKIDRQKHLKMVPIKRCLYANLSVRKFTCVTEFQGITQ